MLGLGETEPELFQTMDDLREVGCQVLTLGQYLRPTPQHLPVVEFVSPERFDAYGEIAREKGFRARRFRSARAQLLSRGRFPSGRPLKMEERPPQHRDRSEDGRGCHSRLITRRNTSRDVVRRTLEQLDHVLVVDDGSTRRDGGSGAECRRGSDRSPAKPSAKANRSRPGLRHWLERGMHYVVILDADGQHLPEEIERFIAAAAASMARELLIGTRMNDVREMPLVRRIGQSLHEPTRSAALCGQDIPDTQCGFRMVHRSLIPDLLGGTERFDYETEMLILASRKGCRIESVPISTVYSDEVSSIHPVRDTIRFFKLMRRYRKA